MDISLRSKDETIDRNNGYGNFSYILVKSKVSFKLLEIFSVTGFFG